MLSAPAAYSLARFDIPGKTTILAVLILIQMVPAIVMAIPVLRIFQILDLTDTVDVPGHRQRGILAAVDHLAAPELLHGGADRA